MTVLHTIKVDGKVDSKEWTGRLDYGCPPWEEMKRLVGCEMLEHVTVMWEGRRAHMFVNEVGLLEGLAVNPKATAVYWNATRDRAGQLDLLYYHLDREPPVTEADLHKLNPIVGTALLWEGDME